MGSVIKGGKIEVTVTPTPPATNANILKISCSQESKLLIQANSNRKGVVIYNHCIYALYIKFGDGQPVSKDNFTIVVPAGSTYEMTLPFVGRVYGVWDHLEPDGVAIITELY